MKNKELKFKMTAVILAASITLTTVPVYAEEEETIVVEDVSNSEEGANFDEVEIETLTITVEEIPEETSNVETTNVENPDDTSLGFEGPISEGPISEGPISEGPISEEPDSEEPISDGSDLSEKKDITETSIDVKTESEIEETEGILASDETVAQTSEVKIQEVKTQDENKDETTDEEIISNTKDETKDEVTISNTNVETADEVTISNTKDETTDEVTVSNTNDESPANNVGASAIDLSKDKANDGGELTEVLQEIYDSFNEEERVFETEINFTKTLSDFSVSKSSTGRYNAQFVITELENSTGTEKKFNYTVSGFKTEELAREYAEKIEKLGKLLSGDTYYLISDPNLIDAEKRPLSEANATAETGTDYDLYLCWAGSISDMLELSGWNKAERLPNSIKEIISNEDDAFDFFANSFTNNAGNQYFGLDWFFNGAYFWQGDDSAAQLKDYYDDCNDGYTSPMLREYCSADFISQINPFSVTDLSDALKCLDADADGDRCTIGLVFGYYERDEDGNLNRLSGHCVTIVGYSTDENGVPNTITIADSDSYNNYGEPDTPASKRSDYINTYNTYPVEYYDGRWHIMNCVGNGCDTIIDDLDILKYYSDNTKNKFEQGGSLDLKNDYDFSITANSLWDNAIVGNYYTVYQGDTLRAYIEYINRGLRSDSLDGTTITFRYIISKDGENVRVLDFPCDFTGLNDNWKGGGWIENIMDAEHPLEPGEYTVSYIINYDRSVKEAYYNNNSKMNASRFIVLRRVDENGEVSYVVIPDEEDEKEENNNTTQEEYENSVIDFLKNILDYSAVTDQSEYEKDKTKVFEFAFSNGIVDANITEADLANAEILFDYSVTGEINKADGTFGGAITSNVVITKNDFSIVRNADGSINIVFSNEFMRKLPKGTHYFKMVIAGKTHIFKIEVK